MGLFDKAKKNGVKLLLDGAEKKTRQKKSS